MIGMADRNEDDLNQFSRKSCPDLADAAFKGTNQAYHDAARPTADIVLPTLTEHTIGQLMQMLMLATVVEGRLMGINPYGQPGVEAYKQNMTRDPGEHAEPAEGRGPRRHQGDVKYAGCNFRFLRSGCARHACHTTVGLHEP